jgi:hypothetical protein
VEACLLTEWDDVVYAKMPFTVLRFEDFSKRIDLMEKRVQQTSTTFGCMSYQTSQPLFMKASIPFSMYTTEQKIRITIFIDNRCGFEVSKTIISLKRKHIFTSMKPEKKTISHEKTIAKAICEGVRDKTKKKILASIEVPPLTLTNSSVSKVCQLTYNLHIAACVVGFLKKPAVQFEIFVGSKPLNYEYKQVLNCIKNN